MRFKRKKVTKQRGSKTHGWGAKKKHRGAGNRGGRGMAGTGKRGDAKKPSIQKNKEYFGKHGFKSLKSNIQKKLREINIERLEEQLPKLLNKKEAEKKGKAIFINLKKLGYNKLLGKGKVKNKLEINVDYASKKAVEKIEKLGGKVNILVIKREKPKKVEEKKIAEPVEEVVEEPEREGKEEVTNEIAEKEIKE